MNDEELNELFDIDGMFKACLSRGCLSNPFSNKNEEMLYILKAATAGREYQLKPEQTSAKHLFNGLLSVKKEGDEILIGDNSYYFAAMQGALAYDDDKDKERALYIATAVNDAMSKPQSRDWDGVEPLAVGMSVMSTQFKTEIIALNHKDSVLKFGDGGIAVVRIEDLKPIPPKPKKIDHSSLVGSGIDCVYSGYDESVDSDFDYISKYVPDCSSFKSIRMNHPLVLSNRQIKSIPEGYKYDILDSSIAGTNCKVVMIDSIKEGYEL